MFLSPMNVGPVFIYTHSLLFYSFFYCRCGSSVRRRHVPWDPFKDKGPLGEDKRPDRREGGEVKLDPLGVLIMGEMVDIHRSKVIPI